MISVWVIGMSSVPLLTEGTRVIRDSRPALGVNETCSDDAKLLMVSVCVAGSTVMSALVETVGANVERASTDTLGVRIS